MATALCGQRRLPALTLAPRALPARRGRRGRRAAAAAPPRAAAGGQGPQEDDGRRSPNDVDESDPEQRALLDAENDMLAADLGSFASASVDDLAEDQEADIFLQVKDAIDTFLLYDFFVICVILLWLVVGVTYRVTVGGGLEVDEPIVGVWLTLWPVIFLPLLSIHMGATLLSPALGWAKRNGYLGENTWT